MTDTPVTQTTASELMLNPTDPRERGILVVEREFQLAQRKANVLASSDIVPAQFKGKLANCVIAMEIADRLKTGVMEIMQNLYVVHGNPAFSSKYLIAMINRSGILTGRLRFEFVGTSGGEDYGCYAVGIEAATGQELKGTTVTVQMAKDQGWWGKNGSKWPSMTDQMLQYRAAAFWSRINAPEATMGMGTVEEQVDSKDEIDITPGAETITGSVADMIAKTPAKQAAPAAASTENDDTSGSVVIEGESETVVENQQEPHGGDAIDVETQKTGHVPTEDEDNRPWPRMDDGFWHDSAGQMYDETKHGWSGDHQAPSVKDDGSFRAKRGLAAKEVPAENNNQQQQQQGPGDKSAAYVHIANKIKIAMTPSDLIDVDGLILEHAIKLNQGEKEILVAQKLGRKEYLQTQPTG